MNHQPRNHLDSTLEFNFGEKKLRNFIISVWNLFIQSKGHAKTVHAGNLNHVVIMFVVVFPFWQNVLIQKKKVIVHDFFLHEIDIHSGIALKKQNTIGPPIGWLQIVQDFKIERFYYESRILDLIREQTILYWRTHCTIREDSTYFKLNTNRFLSSTC